MKAFGPGWMNRKQAADNLDSEQRSATALRAKLELGTVRRLRAGGTVCLGEQRSRATEAGSPGCPSHTALTVCPELLLKVCQIPGEAQAPALHIQP